MILRNFLLSFSFAKVYLLHLKSSHDHCYLTKKSIVQRCKNHHLKTIQGVFSPHCLSFLRHIYNRQTVNTQTECHHVTNTEITGT